MIKFFEIVLIPHLIEMKELPRQEAECPGVVSSIEFTTLHGHHPADDGRQISLLI